MSAIAAEKGRLDADAVSLPGLGLSGAVTDPAEDLRGHERAWSLKKKKKEEVDR